MSPWQKYIKKIRKYFSEHPDYNGMVHFITGMGVGILLTYPLVKSHPVRWSIVLLVLALVGHLYPIVVKK